jgi:hypothetical protein
VTDSTERIRAEFDKWFKEQSWILGNADLAFTVWRAATEAALESVERVAQKLADEAAVHSDPEAAGQYNCATEIIAAIRALKPSADRAK